MKKLRNFPKTREYQVKEQPTLSESGVCVETIGLGWFHTKKMK